jgi:KUP system potassium uptake protein
MQRFGTARVGGLFGPVMLVWLLVIGLLGLFSLARQPQVLAAINPWHAIEFFHRNGFAGFTTLGATVLVLTGAEALYADMGHFGARPIRAAWTTVALPCLLLSYFGQGALLLMDPTASAGPFYRMVPSWALYPMIALATAATVIASQAVISGAYSMIREAMQLGYLPRMRVLQTSSQVRGQIYLPAVNTILFVLVLAATLGFRSSSALAASFGIAVSGTMLMTTILVLVVMRRLWHWSLHVVVPLAVAMLTVDLAFFGANLMKLGSGGWFPLALGIVVLVVMTTWQRGRELLSAHIRDQGVPLAPCVTSLRDHPPIRVPGTALFLTMEPTLVPQALLHNLKHNKVLHERNAILTVEVLDEPFVPAHERVSIEPMGDRFYRIRARFGFAEDPDVPAALDACAVRGLGFDLMETTFFTSRENIVPGDRTGMASWRDRLFAFLTRNALPATAFFRIPDNRLIEIGRRVAI